VARNTLIDFLEYNHREDLVSKVAEILAADLISSVKGGGNAIFSVPGGSTPGPIFDKLCEFDLDWKRVSIILNDERWVPETSERSNTKLLRERLLIKKASLATYISMYSDVLTPEVGIPKLQERIERNLPISVLLFGMGADMHTASLFPGGDNLEKALSSNAPTLLPMRAEGALEARITLTAQVLNRSRIKHLVIFGKEKRTALEKAIDLPNRLAPISAILPGASVHWAA
jgi:6-phosphogluconolactonase